MNTYAVNGTYGQDETPCTIFVAAMTHGGFWYAVEDICNVNFTLTELTEGVDVETLEDTDCFTVKTGISTEHELAVAIFES